MSPFHALGLDDALCRRVLTEATRNGADDAELFFEHRQTTTVGLSDHAVNRASLEVDGGVGIRVVIGDQVGYAYTQELELPAMLRAARIASQIARGASRGPVDPQPVRVGDYYPVHRPWSTVGVDQRVPLVREWERMAFAADPRVEKVQTSLVDVDRHIWIVTADGRSAHDHQPMTTGAVTCTAASGAARETSVHKLSARAGIESYTAERQHRLVSVAVERAIRNLDATAPPPGNMPIVLACGSAGILLHEAIGHGLEADFNRKRISLYADRLGQQIAPEFVTVVDDGTLPGARGSINVDDEATPTERTVLVQNGILQGFLHDRISARHYKVAPTGSGRRESYRFPVLPRMRSTYIEAGPHDPAEILASVEHGLFCEVLGNGEVEIGGGDFAFFVKHGWLIEHGKLTRPIKDANLVGSGPAVLAAMDMVGNDLLIDESAGVCGKDGQGVPVSVGMPTVKVRSMAVG